jgi:hypothetical protein
MDALVDGYRIPFYPSNYDPGRPVSERIALPALRRSRLILDLCPIVTFDCACLFWPAAAVLGRHRCLGMSVSGLFETTRSFVSPRRTKNALDEFRHAGYGSGGWESAFGRKNTTDGPAKGRWDSRLKCWNHFSRIAVI